MAFARVPLGVYLSYEYLPARSTIFFLAKIGGWRGRSADVWVCVVPRQQKALPVQRLESGVTRLRYFHGVQELQGTWGLGDPWGVCESRRAGRAGTLDQARGWATERWVRYNHCVLRSR